MPARGRGRPRGSGRGRGSARGGHTVGDNVPQGSAVQPPTSVALSAPGDATEADIVNRPRRTGGKYNPGEAIIDTVPRRSSDEVQLAKKMLQEKMDAAEAAAEAQKIAQRREIAALEDMLRLAEVEKNKKAGRPDLVDQEPLAVEVRNFFISNLQYIYKSASTLDG